MAPCAFSRGNTFIVPPEKGAGQGPKLGLRRKLYQAKALWFRGGLNCVIGVRKEAHGLWRGGGPQSGSHPNARGSWIGKRTGGGSTKTQGRRAGVGHLRGDGGEEKSPMGRRIKER